MATILTGLGQVKVINNLDTYTYTANSSAMHVAKITLTERPTSGVSIVIKQNATTVATSTAPAPQQQVINLSATMNIVSGDVISFVITSSVAEDKKLNRIQGTINIHIGSLN